MESTPSFAVHTLGCKLNYSESSAIARSLVESGYSKVQFKEKADIYVINTCSVTQEADKECRQVVRSALQRSPGAFIAVTGCYAQLKPAEIAAIEGVDIVLGAAEKFNLPQYIGNLDKKGFAEVHSCEIGMVNGFHSAYSAGDRTRSFLKVQDGCDYSCTYCTIPLARGASRSDTIANVLKNVKTIAAKGVKEIVLTGVNLGDFRDRETDTGLFDLMQALEDSDPPMRFRISSIEPNLLKDEMIKWVSKSKKFVHHFHIPLQSGCNYILKQMRRRYLRELYAEKVSLIKSLMPHCSIGADVITGFPGETEEHFTETYNFLHTLDITYLHVFTYSERDDTAAAAASIGNGKAVLMQVRRKRNRMLQILSEKKALAFYMSQRGATRTVLFEAQNRNGCLFGYTDNYVRIKVLFDPALQGKLMQVQIEQMAEDGNMTAAIQHRVIAKPAVELIQI